ncbi:hypothetical protein WK34_05955 [Burkholderia vietnamiensis]|nr:hypothetical protein WK34_05955 [Burkholderia vietnamiensis]
MAICIWERRIFMLGILQPNSMMAISLRIQLLLESLLMPEPMAMLETRTTCKLSEQGQLTRLAQHCSVSIIQM